MKKITDYYVVHRELEPHFEDEMSRLINEGFQPYGGLCVILDKEGQYSFFQAVVCYEE